MSKVLPVAGITATTYTFYTKLRICLSLLYLLLLRLLSKVLPVADIPPGIRGGSRIYKRGGGLTQGTNLLGRGVQSTLPSMQSMLELGGCGGMPPPGNF